jgi:hypothetical protein
VVVPNEKNMPRMFQPRDVVVGNENVSSDGKGTGPEESRELSDRHSDMGGLIPASLATVSLGCSGDRCLLLICTWRPHTSIKRTDEAKNGFSLSFF